MKSLRACVATVLFVAGSGVYAAESGKPMKMDEPMHGEMKKKGMKKGDVKKAAERKGREMKPAMEKDRAGGAKK